MAELSEDQLKVEWDKADTDKSGTLDFKEIVKLLDKLNLKLKEKEAKKIFKEVDADKSGHLDFEEFRVFLSLLRTRPEVAQLFDTFYEQFHADETEEDDFSKEKDRKWTATNFLQFLKTVQKENDVTIEDAKAIIESVEHKKHKKEGEHKEPHLTVRGLSAYMSSSQHNTVFEPKHTKTYQDMSQPFCHYYVASSHNTYLLGDQLKGESSVEAYINAFNKGCKCVELDCWDGENKEPIIYHGHTLTSKITFQSVVETVRDHGFKLSPMPVILSLEVHCSIEGQQNMAKILRDVLGAAGMLPEQPEVTGILPSPDKILNKVLLKGKMLSKKPPVDPSANPSETPAEEEDEDEEEEEEEQPINESQNKTKERSQSSITKERSASSVTKEATSPGKEEVAEKGAKKKGEKKKKESTAAELSELIHLKTGHMRNFEENRKKKPDVWAMSSFAEGKVEKFVKTSALDFIDYNSRQLSRIYPKGIRVDSSNYDPVPSWNCGSQIVALNYQTGSEPMWLNDGKFLGNGGSGFILKPKYMREEKITVDPSRNTKVEKTLTVRLISGWQFPKVHGTGKEKSQKGEIIDPYAKVSIRGIGADDNSFKSKTIKNNGFNPVWNETYRFPLRAPELAHLLVAVYDEDLVSSDDFIGQYSCALDDVREGYRVVPLKDKYGKLYEKASVLVHISIEEGEVKADKHTEKQEAFLLKKTSSMWNNKWIQRYFVLQDGSMKYWQNKTTDQKKPRKEFSIVGITCVPIKVEESAFKFTFAVITAQRTWFLKAASAKELRDWRRNILAQGGKWIYKYADNYFITKEGVVQKVAAKEQE